MAESPQIFALRESYKAALLYRVAHLVADLVWVDLEFCIPTSCPLAQPLLPNFHWQRQNWADRGRKVLQVIIEKVKVAASEIY